LIVFSVLNCWSIVNLIMFALTGRHWLTSWTSLIAHGYKFVTWSSRNQFRRCIYYVEGPCKAEFVSFYLDQFRNYAEFRWRPIISLKKKKSSLVYSTDECELITVSMAQTSRWFWFLEASQTTVEGEQCFNLLNPMKYLWECNSHRAVWTMTT